RGRPRYPGHRADPRDTDKSSSFSTRQAGMTRIVTLGDSITLGMGDPVPGGWRGWAWHLADGLPKPELHNLAANGAQAKHVERDQLPNALLLRPHVASVVVGINDTLRAGFDPVRTGQAIARTVAALSAGGA